MGTLEKALLFLAGLLAAPVVGFGLGFTLFLAGVFVLGGFGLGAAGSGAVLVGIMAGTAFFGLVAAAGLTAALWTFIRRNPWTRWFTYGALVGFALGWLAFWGSCGLLLTSVSGGGF